MKNNRWIAVMVAAAMVVTCVAMPVSSNAAEGNEKEEVVYVMTDARGEVSSVNVVNIFGSGQVTDYGHYSSVQMLTSNNTISQDEDRIAFASDKERVYYQGTMENAQIPWNISITYFLDGKRIDPEELAGQSGKLKIKTSITENSKSNKSFFANYALQASFTLDTEKCENIVADGATMANVGSDKQLNYTILPGEGLETSITADVTDFEMDPVTINGIKLNLNLEIDDAELMEKVSEIMDAASKLNEGTSELLTGAGDLSDGMNSLHNGIAELKTKSSFSSYKNAMKSNGLDIDELKAGNSKAIGSIETQISGLKSSIQTIKNIPGYESNSEYVAQIKALETQVTELSNIVELLKANNASISGTEAYLTAIGSGASSLTEGSNALKTGINKLYDGLNKMLKGTTKFYDKTANMDEQVQDQIDEMIASISGDETETVSFVSKKNTNVKSVQFVIKTDQITKASKEAQKEKEPQKKTFWQKLLALFGL